MDKIKYTICLIFALQTVFCQSNNECFTPSDQSGICINLRSCPRLRFLLENERKNATVVSLLRNSFCGYEGKEIKVCCPLDDEVFTTTEYSSTTKKRTEPTTAGGQQIVLSSKLPSQNTCGKTNTSQNRIVGGHPADLGAWPWMTALGYQDLSNSNNRAYQWLCGGTLISDRYVITAAHCTVGIGKRKLAVAHLGDLNLDNNIKDGASPIDVPIARVMAHDRYNAQEYTNDIALLKLENSVTFNKLIQPICLPISTEHRSKKFVNLTPFVTGWGSTSFRGPATTKLMEIQIPVMDNADCKRAFVNKKVTVDDRVICAGVLTGGKDACQGDSGGPLMWPGGNQQFYLVGIVSFGYKCAEPGYPGVYTRVTSFVEWIAETINNS